MGTDIHEMYDTYSVKCMLITHHIVKKARQWLC